jgi:hypothetical protein
MVEVTGFEPATPCLQSHGEIKSKSLSRPRLTQPIGNLPRLHALGILDSVRTMRGGPLRKVPLLTEVALVISVTAIVLTVAFAEDWGV